MNRLLGCIAEKRLATQWSNRDQNARGARALERLLRVSSSLVNQANAHHYASERALQVPARIRIHIGTPLALHDCACDSQRGDECVIRVEPKCYSHTRSKPTHTRTSHIHFTQRTHQHTPTCHTSPHTRTHALMHARTHLRTPQNQPTRAAQTKRTTEIVQMALVAAVTRGRIGDSVIWSKHRP